MKILKEGNKLYVPDFGGTVTCPKCDSVLDYSQDDVRYYESSTKITSAMCNNNFGTAVSSPISYYYIVCPRCGKIIKVKKKVFLNKKKANKRARNS